MATEFGSLSDMGNTLPIQILQSNNIANAAAWLMFDQTLTMSPASPCWSIRALLRVGGRKMGVKLLGTESF